MHSVLTIARKELRQIFLSPIAYAFLVVFIFFVTFMFFRDFFLIRQTSMAQFFGLFPIAFAVVLPGVAMRVWAEERKQGTIEFLLTSPIETWHIVVGKFLACLALVALCVLFTLWVPITVAGYGDLDLGPVIGGYLGSDTQRWADYDATLLTQKTAWRRPVLVDQGTADPFLDRELMPSKLEVACKSAGIPLELRMQAGYDHSYYFIATFVADHIAFHAKALKT